ncbi:MAG: hypothetical protein ABJE47_21835 [bacterium]
MHDDTRSDDNFEDFLKREAKGYAAPSVPPADAMWAAIEADVAKAITPVRRIQPRRVWLAVGAAMAATLVIGVSVGRWAERHAAGTVTTASAVGSASTTPDRATAERRIAHTQASAAAHLEETELFLTSVRADLKAGRTDADRAARSRELLSRTRLLLSAPAGASPAVTQLLEDLELLLAEIAATPRNDGSMDKTLLNDTMRDGDVLVRIRTMLPARSAGT